MWKVTSQPEENMRIKNNQYLTNDKWAIKTLENKGINIWMLIFKYFLVSNKKMIYFNNYNLICFYKLFLYLYVTEHYKVFELSPINIITQLIQFVMQTNFKVLNIMPPTIFVELNNDTFSLTWFCDSKISLSILKYDNDHKSHLLSYWNS